MREILFRGKRVDNGEWVEGQTIVVIHQDDNDLIFMPQHGEDVKADPMEDNDRALTSIYGNYYQILPQTVEQYTGLTDKNGKKIFEGDIIKIVPDYDYSDDYIISKVYSYNGISCVDYHGDDFDSTALGFLDDYLPDGDFEVIGNIHDNPKLLEVTK